jgi:hypothetical protein
MDMSYGERKTFLFLDDNNNPVAYKNFTLTSVTEDSSITETRQTDADGRAGFDILSTRYFKYGNSLENGGKAGTPGQSDYQYYTFSADGYFSYPYPYP